MAAALIPCLFTLGAAAAVCTIIGTLRAYAPAIRALLREATEGYPGMSKRYYISPGLIIEISPREPRASACLPDGREVSEEPTIAADLADCTRSGGCEPACEYVRGHVGVDWRIVARNDAGDYENREATDAEMQSTCEAIYFDSEVDFTDRDTCETYLIWEAAHDAQQSTGD